MKIKRIEHIAIAVADLDGMAGMLRDKFGIAVEYSEDIARSRTRLAMLPVGESYIELLQGMAPTSRAAEWVAQKGQSLFHICFEVEDLDGIVESLRQKGHNLVGSVQNYKNVWKLCYIRGPEGLIIELAEQLEK